jgi:PhnB protein
MQLLNPYLHFNGQCEEAFNCYAKVLDGGIIAMMPRKGTPAEEHVPAEWQNKIIHARLMVGDKLLMASDAPPRFDQPKGLLGDRGRRYGRRGGAHL